MYVKLAEMAKELRPLRFGWFSILTRCHNTKILSNMRTYFTNECEARETNEYYYDYLINYLEFAKLTDDIYPPVRSGIFIYSPEKDISKTSYKCKRNAIIIDISKTITPFDRLAMYIDTDEGTIEVKYVSNEVNKKDVFMITKARGSFKYTDDDATHSRIFALQEIRYAILCHIQQYIGALYELYT